jgi:hypothetical protein
VTVTLSFHLFIMSVQGVIERDWMMMVGEKMTNYVCCACLRDTRSVEGFVLIAATSEARRSK